jgi:ATP-dependent DNA ligase
MGELLATDEREAGFQSAAEFRQRSTRIQFHVFDLLSLKDRDLIRLPLIEDEHC